MSAEGREEALVVEVFVADAVETRCSRAKLERIAERLADFPIWRGRECWVGRVFAARGRL